MARIFFYSLAKERREFNPEPTRANCPRQEIEEAIEQNDLPNALGKTNL